VFNQFEWTIVVLTSFFFLYGTLILLDPWIPIYSKMIRPLLNNLVWHSWVRDGFTDFGGLGLTKESARVRGLLCATTTVIIFSLILKIVFNLDMFEEVDPRGDKSRLSSVGEPIIVFVLSTIGSYMVFYQVFLGEFVSKYEEVAALVEKTGWLDLSYGENSKKNGHTLQAEPFKPPKRGLNPEKIRMLDFKTLTLLNLILVYRLEQNDRFRFLVNNFLASLLKLKEQMTGKSWRGYIEPFSKVCLYVDSMKPELQKATFVLVKNYVVVVTGENGPDDDKTPPGSVIETTGQRVDQDEDRSSQSSAA
jgi:hypothetical protein